MQRILTEQRSSIGSPYAYYTVDVDYSERTTNSVKISVTVTSRLASSGSYFGTGLSLIGSILIGNSWRTIQLKSTSESWSGTTNHYASGTFLIEGINPTDTSLTNIRFKVDRGDSQGSSCILYETGCNNITIPIGHTPPTINWVTVAENTTNISNQLFVAYLSSKRFTINVTTHEGATVTDYKVANGTERSTHGSSNVQNLSFSTGLFVQNNKVPILVTVTDSLGSVSTLEILYDNYDNTYILPNLIATSSTIKRNGQLSGKALLNLTGKWHSTSVSGRTSSLQLQYKYWQKGTTEPTQYFTIPYTADSDDINVYNWHIAKNGTEITDVNPSYDYYFKIKATDGWSKTSEITLFCAKGEYVWAEYKDYVDFKNIKIGGNYIIESGSNSNGNWIKYADGTMICYREITKSLSYSISWGGGVIASDTTTYSFAQTFISTPIILKDVRLITGSSGILFDYDNTVITTSSYKNYSLYRPGGSTSQSCQIVLTILAIGKWK